MTGLRALAALHTLLGRFGVWLFVLAAPLLLSSCLLTPGKFTSSLVINADRSFVFTYQGEVISIDLAEELLKKTLGRPGTDDPDAEDGASGGDDSDDATDVATARTLAWAESSGAGGTPEPWAWRRRAALGLTDDKLAEDKKTGCHSTAACASADTSPDTADNTEEKNREIAAALSQQEGFRSVVYRGNNRFDIDYRIEGRLDYSFVFPYNAEPRIVTPFLSVEVRKGGVVSFSADGFASSKRDDNWPKPDPSAPWNQRDGVFTLDTNALVVSQNGEKSGSPILGRALYRWRLTAKTTETPMAVLQLPAKPAR